MITTVPVIICPGDGIGIRTGLRSQVLWVRVPPGAPYNRKNMKDAVTMCAWTARQRRIRKLARKWAKKIKHKNGELAEWLKAAVC